MINILTEAYYDTGGAKRIVHTFTVTHTLKIADDTAYSEFTINKV